MFTTQHTIHTAGSDMRAMMNDAEHVLSEAADATGDKASLLQKQGLELLASGMAKAHDLERLAIKSAKELAQSTDTLVHDNPWRSMAISGLIGAGVGMALGLALSRKA